MTRTKLVLAVGLLMPACSPPGAGQGGTSANAATAAVHAVAPATPAFHQIASDTFAMVYDAASPRPAVEQAMRGQCAGKQWCKVFGWTAATAAATAMPMTDREADALKVSYTLNRATGVDEVRWA